MESPMNNNNNNNNPAPQTIKAKNALIKFYPSWTSIAILIYFIISLLINGRVQPFTRRGFFCNDSTINYPFKPDTIGIKTLLFVVLVIPSIVIKCCDLYFYKLITKLPYQGKSVLLSEQFYYRSRRRKSFNNDHILEVDAEEEELISDTTSNPIVKRRKLLILDDEGDSNNYTSIRTNPNGLSSIVNNNNSNKNGMNSDEANTDSDGEVNLFSTIPLDSDNDESNNSTNKRDLASVPNYLDRKFSECQLYLFGVATTMFLTGLGKITCGRLRPHFMQVCSPNIDCNSPSNRNKYIETFGCANELSNHPNYPYITTSWPSGHASIAFYSMLYVVIYLQTTIPLIVQLAPEQIKRRHNPLIMNSFYVILIGMAGYIALTRVSDYHHHPTDVLSGSVLGSIIAVALSRYILSRNYSKLIVR